MKFSKNIYDILCFHLDTVHVIHIYKIFDLIDAWISILHDGLQPFRFRLVWNTTYDDYSGIYLGLFRNIPLKHMQDISVSPLKGFMCMFFVLHLFCKYYNFYTIIGKECFDHESLSWKHWLIPFNDYWLRIVKTHNHKRRFRNLEMLLYAHDFCHRFANRMEKLFEWSKYYPNQRELLFYKNEIKDMTNLNGILINGTLTKYELTMIMSYNIRHMEELTGWAYIPHDVIIMIQKLVSLSTYSTKKTQPLKVRDLHTENSRIFPFDQFDVKTGQWFACTAAWSDESLVVNNTFHMVAHNKNCIDSEQILLNYQALTHEDYSQHLYVEDTFCIKVGTVSARLPYKYRSWKLLQYIFVNMKHEFISMPHIDEILPRFHVKNDHESWIIVQIIEMQSWCGQIRVVFITGATKWYHIDDEFHVMSIYEMKQKQLKKLLTNTWIGLGNKMYWQNRLNQMIQLHIVFFKSVVGINSIQQFYTEIKSPSAETKQIINIASLNIFPLTKHQFDILVKIRDFSLRKEENKYWNDPKEKKLFMLKYISQTKQWKIERSDRLYQIGAIDKCIITEKLPYRKSLQKYSTKNINKIINQYKHHAQVQEFNIFDGENSIVPIDPRDMYKYYQNNYDLKSTYTQETESEYDEKKEIIENDIAENIDLWNMELVIDTSILRCELIETGKIARSQIVRVKQQQYLDSFVYDFKKNYRKHGLFGVRGRGKRAVKNPNNQRSKGRGRGRGRGRGFQARMDHYNWSAW